MIDGGLGIEPTLSEVEQSLPTPYMQRMSDGAKTDVRGAIIGLMNAYEVDGDLCSMVRDYLWFEANEIQGELLAHKPMLPSDLAARGDDYTRGRLAAFSQVRDMLTDMKVMRSTLNDLESSKGT